MKKLVAFFITIVLLVHGLGPIMPFMAAWMPSISKVGFSDAPWIFGGSTIDSLVGQIFGVLALGVLVGFMVGVFALWTHKEWAGRS